MVWVYVTVPLLSKRPLLKNANQQQAMQQTKVQVTTHPKDTKHKLTQHAPDLKLLSDIKINHYGQGSDFWTCYEGNDSCLGFCSQTYNRQKH